MSTVIERQVADVGLLTVTITSAATRTFQATVSIGPRFVDITRMPTRPRTAQEIFADIMSRPWVTPRRRKREPHA